MRTAFAVCLTLFSATTTSHVAAANADTWTVQERRTLGGEGGWDLLAFDPAQHRLFIPRDTHVMVVDTHSFAVVGDIPGIKHAHAVALVPGLQRGYVSNGHGDSVTVFDLGSLKTVAEIPVGKDPDVMLFDETSGRVFAFNGHSNDVSVIDPHSDKVVATMPAPGRPEFAVSDGSGHLYFNLEDSNRIARADAKQSKVDSSWPLEGCEGPTGLAIDVAHARLFSVCANKRLIVVDAHSGKNIATLPIGDKPDAIAYDPGTATLFVSNNDGTLTVAHQDDADHYRVVANVVTPPRSRTLALDATEHKVYLAAAEFGQAPAPTADEPHPKPAMKAGSFGLVVIGKR
jgi:YVTN family beta-propeller protein